MLQRPACFHLLANCVTIVCILTLHLHRIQLWPDAPIPGRFLISVTVWGSC